MTPFSSKRTTNLPRTCPDCRVPTNELNLSVNASFRNEDGFTGETEYDLGGYGLPEIGAICPDCGREWIDAARAKKALEQILDN